MPFPAATGPYPPLAFLSLVSRHNERDICILDGADLAPVSPGSDRWIEVSPCFLATVMMIPFGERSSLRASISRCWKDGTSKTLFTELAKYLLIFRVI